MECAQQTSICHRAARIVLTASVLKGKRKATRANKQPRKLPIRRGSERTAGQKAAGYLSTPMRCNDVNVNYGTLEEIEIEIRINLNCCHNDIIYGWQILCSVPSEYVYIVGHIISPSYGVLCRWMCVCVCARGCAVPLNYVYL